jgi:hypothetical protein
MSLSLAELPCEHGLETIGYLLALARLEAQVLSKNGRFSAVVPDSYAAFAATAAICNPRRRPPVQGAITYRRFHSVRRTLCAAVSLRPGSGGFRLFWESIFIH